MNKALLSSSKLAIFWTLTAIFVYLRLNHIPWRDEIQIWILTQNSDLKDIWQEHTVNGSLILLITYKLLILIGMSYNTYNLLVTLFVTFSLLIFLNSKNLPLLYRLILVFTPVYFYEYLVLNRTYCLYFALMALSLSIASNKQQSAHRIIYISMFISCLGFFGLITALFLTISLFLIPQQKRIKISGIKKTIIILLSGVNVIPFVTNFGKDIASSPNTKLVIWNPFIQLKTTLVNFSKTFFGLSDMNSPHILERDLPKTFPVEIAILMSISLILLILIQTSFASISHAICGGIFSFGLFMFFVLIYPAANRHFILILLYTLWSFGFSQINKIHTKKRAKKMIEEYFRFSVLSIGLVSILIQSVNASLAVKAELKFPFSSIHELRDNKFSESVLFYPDFLGISFRYVKPYSKTIEYESYFPEGNYFGVYRDYGNSRNLKSTVDLKRFCESEKRKVMVTYLNLANRIEQLKLGKLIRLSSVAIVRDESEIAKVDIENTCQTEENQNRLLQTLRKAKAGNFD